VRFAAWSSLLIGIGMFAQWVLFLVAGQVPELATEPWSIGLHLAAEAVTALALIASGFGLLRATYWAPWLCLVANGMLVYTAIASPGYFAQLGQWPFVGMFVAILGVATVSITQIARSMRRPEEASPSPAPAGDPSSGLR
jgi:hypothetical protein